MEDLRKYFEQYGTGAYSYRPAGSSDNERAIELLEREIAELETKKDMIWERIFALQNVLEQLKSERDGSADN